MNQAEYERMAKIYRYVYCTAPNTVERQKRIAEIGEEDSSKLWDFYCGICQGKIKQPEFVIGEKKVVTMNGKTNELYELRKNDPEAFERRCEQLKKTLGLKKPITTQKAALTKEERKKRSEILSIPDTMTRHKAISENMALFRR